MSFLLGTHLNSPDNQTAKSFAFIAIKMAFLISPIWISKVALIFGDKKKKTYLDQLYFEFYHHMRLLVIYYKLVKSIL